MAQVLTEMPKISRVGGGRKGSKYPLDEWFDGQPRELVAGEDFDCKAESLINMLHGKAAAQGLKVKAIRTEAGFALVAFQAPTEDEASENGDSNETEADADEE